MKHIPILTAFLFLTITVSAQDTLREYHPNGKIALEYPKLGNESDGLCRTWYDNGRISSSGYYDSGEQIGVWKSWYPDGNTRVKQKYENGIPVENTSWYPNGHKSHYQKNTDKKTVIVFWNEKGIKTLSLEYKGKPAVLNVSKETGDTLFEVMPGTKPLLFKNRTAIDNKTLMEMNDFSGKVMMKYENGQQKYEAHYKHGEKHGRFREWDSGGKLFLDETWKNGLLVPKV